MTESARHPSDEASGQRQSWRQWASTATRLVILVSAVGAIVLTTASAAPPAARTSDGYAKRYAGTWYEVARVPNRFQAQCQSDVTATYQPMDDGSLTVINRCRGADARWDVAVGRATPTAGPGGPRLKLSFQPGWLRWLPGTRDGDWVVMPDAGYRYTVVSDPQRQYLWILSRTPAMPAGVLEKLVSRLRAEGYPVDSLVPTDQGSLPVDRAMVRRTQLII